MLNCEDSITIKNIHNEIIGLRYYINGERGKTYKKIKKKSPAFVTNGNIYLLTSD
jgi:hypothetical protein